MPKSFADFLDSMRIAMEADDITQQTQDDTRAAMGGGSMRTDDDGPEDDITRTTDIFNQNPEDLTGDNPNTDEDEPESQDTTGEDRQGEGGDQTQDEQTDETGQTDDPNLQEDTNQTAEQPKAEEDPLFAKKNPIRDNLAQLYTIVSGDIEIISTSLNNMNDLPSIKVANAVLRHLRNCKTYIYKTLTEDAPDIEYDELLRRYITLKRIYEVCVKMLEVHFKDEDRLQFKPKKKK